jgi:hypothetical protein
MFLARPPHQLYRATAL